MASEHLKRERRRVGLVLSVVLGIWLLWFFSPGIPVFWGPYASATVKEAGKEIFTHEWQPNDPMAAGDGLGPVFNAHSCVACHSQGGVGGGGPVQQNVTTFEVHPTKHHPEFHNGVVHSEAVAPSFKESKNQLRALFPPIEGPTQNNGCYTTKLPDFDPLHFDSVNSPALFGAGWIDRIGSKAITQNHMSRLLANSAKEFQADFDAPPVGRPRILADRRVGKFGWKAQFATLKEFVAQACANELGLGNPLLEQPKPIGSPAYVSDKRDLDKKQFASLVAFVDTLPRPTEVIPDNSGERDRAARGKEFFTTIGCAVCHTPDIGGVKGVYSDFLLYRIAVRGQAGGGGDYGGQDPPPGTPPLPKDQPAPDEWKTPPLWGVADSAPYFHDGMSPTLKDAILRHGGDAAPITRAYEALTKEDQDAVIAFLQTLKAPAGAEPAPGQKIAQAKTP